MTENTTPQPKSEHAQPLQNQPSLTELGKKYGTDKYEHGFLPFYEQFFEPVRDDVRRVLEIGIADGASIRMWLDYFPNARVFGMEAPGNVPMRYGDKNRWPRDKRFIALMGDQAELSHLRKVLPWGPFDIVVDDGGHTMKQQQTSLEALLVHTTRFYVVEDLHTSFMDTIYISDGRSYATGADRWPTTYDLLKDAPGTHIFDRDGDHKHMTAVIEKGGADG